MTKGKMDNNPDNIPANKLSGESSPYLLQHVYNPVNWYPWGEAAFEQARKHDKPILLSIGYSACHWCHVMMRESFCDPDTAATMNRLFVNIKVDKEERQDLDKIYQTAYQLLMGQPGGWPLTMFLSPSTLIPYYGGTYFPKEPDEQGISFTSILHRLNDVYYHSKERVRQQELQVVSILQIMTEFKKPTTTPLPKILIHKAEVALQQDFDPEHGGFGQDTKFPNCPNLDFILQSTDTMTKHIALTSLNSMAEGGIYDQLAGGFFRYTVDDRWEIPHFEKMLYDNAQLLGIYAKAYKTTHKQNYREIAIETADWLQAVLLDPATGAFFNALDAETDDSEGVFYVWDLDEIKQILSAEEYAQIKKYYHLDHKANFEHKWHLHINPNITSPSLEILRPIKQKLLNIRNARIKPELDTLILTSCNGLAIKGFSEAAQIFANTQYSAIALRTIKFVRDKLYLDGRLYATYQNGTAKVPAFLDDYAFVLDAILHFINGNKEHELMPFCIQLADDLLNNFFDPEQGGFFFTGNDAEKLFYRPKTYTDDAIPSGNGVACLSLLKLGKLLRQEKYIDAVKTTTNSAMMYITEAPDLHLTMCKVYSEVQSE